MNAVLSLYSSTIGKKIVMAVTGCIMAFWLLAHMVGNLQVFLGPVVFNHYAELIQSQIELLWLMRAFMFSAIVLHIWSVVSLILIARAARPQGYVGGRKNRASTIAARGLRIGGVVLLLFLVVHILDLTVGLPAVNPVFEHGAAYKNLTGSLVRAPVAALYIFANIALGMHLYHGIYSVFQTLGINQIGSRDTAHQAGLAFAILVPGGNILIALAILSGIVGA